MDANAAIFLSASVPDPKRNPKYVETADTVAIASAVSALVHVVLGRRRLVWGGHPAITPMVYATAEDMGVDYSKWVVLYQSAFFEDRYPEDNKKFQNIVFVAKEGDREASLASMRKQMLSKYEFGAGIFIGGMEGVVEEFLLFRELQQHAAAIPVTSTGGATIEIASHFPHRDTELETDLDYVSLFHRYLDIPVAEKRYTTPAEQPAELKRRLRERLDDDHRPERRS